MSFQACHMVDAIMFYLVTDTCYQLCIYIAQINNRFLIFKSLNFT